MARITTVYTGKAPGLVEHEILQVLESTHGIAIAFALGKTRAQEVRFLPTPESPVIAEKLRVSTDSTYPPEYWRVRTPEGTVLGIFEDRYRGEVLGVWTLDQVAPPAAEPAGAV